MFFESLSGQIDKDWYCSAGLFDGGYSIEVGDGLTKLKGSCVGICRDCHCYHRKHPTPEQYKEEYGFEYPDDATVYLRKYYGEAGYGNWGAGSYADRKAFSKFSPGVEIICACTPFGRPPVAWRPE